MCVAQGFTIMCIASKTMNPYETVKGSNYKTYRKVAQTTKWRENVTEVKIKM